MNVIVVLGSPNDEDGNLMPVACSRSDKAFEVYQTNPEFKILCTGGKGDHFNRTSRPHAEYLIDYLKKKGVPAHVFLPIVESAFTIEDATLSAPIMNQKKVNNVVLVTSEFHMKRAHMIFSRIFPSKNFVLAKAENSVSENEISKLRAHEEEAYNRDLKYVDKHFPR